MDVGLMTSTGESNIKQEPDGGWMQKSLVPCPDQDEHLQGGQGVIKVCMLKS